MNNYTLTLCISVSVMIILLRERNSLIPFLFGSILIPMNGRIIFFGLDLMSIRIFVFAFLLKFLIFSKPPKLTLTKLDKYIILWFFLVILSYTLLWGSFAALISKLGYTFTSLGTYFVFRVYIQNFNDIEWLLKYLGILCIIVASILIFERYTGKNPMQVLGSSIAFTNIRSGRYRCQGPFGHAILAGTFGATSFPLLLYNYLKSSFKINLHLLSVISSILIVILSASSGPIISLVSAIIAVLFFKYRNILRVIIRLTPIILIFLHLIMKAPVWALVGRFAFIGGSTGHHRYKLLNEFIYRFSEWWLVGIKSTSHWGYYLFDITNNYIRIAVDGGLFTLLLFITIIVMCFRIISLGLIKYKNDFFIKKLFWLLGCSLFAHIVSFYGVSYWDQSIFIYFALLSIISSTNLLILTNST